MVVGEGLWRTFVRAGGDLDKDGDYLNEQIKMMNSGRITSDKFHHNIAIRLQMPFAKWKAYDEEGELPNERLLRYISKIKADFKIAILSNASVGSIEKRLNKKQLDLFNVTVVSAEVGMMKPDQKIFNYTAQKLGVIPEDCLFTDDHKPYLNGAQAVGMKTILFEDTEQFIRDLEKILSQKS